MKLLYAIGLALMLVGCNSYPKNDYRDELKTEMPTPIYKKRFNELTNLQTPNH